VYSSSGTGSINRNSSVGQKLHSLSRTKASKPMVLNRRITYTVSYKLLYARTSVFLFSYLCKVVVFVWVCFVVMDMGDWHQTCKGQLWCGGGLLYSSDPFQGPGCAPLHSTFLRKPNTVSGRYRRCRSPLYTRAPHPEVASLLTPTPV
jgi:hypothetical protein